MGKALKITGIALVVLAVLLVAAFIARHHLLVLLIALAGEPELKPAAFEGDSAEWFDDYYTIFQIDDRTYAIGETRYWQNNFNYLIVGDEQALLYDAGPGIRDIRPLVETLTSLPILFIPSHLHYDHTGNTVQFDRVGIIDVPHLRDSAVDDRLVPRKLQHFGGAEGIEAPSFHVTNWLKPNSRLQLGSRTIEVIYTPGHTADSVSLVDKASGYVFAGDFLVPDVNSEVTYGGRMGDYVQGVNSLLRTAPSKARVFGAHRPILGETSTVPAGIPEISMQDVRDMGAALESIRNGNMGGRGIFPVIYTINSTLELWGNPPWLQEWTPAYPQFDE